MLASGAVVLMKWAGRQRMLCAEPRLICRNDLGPRHLLLPGRRRAGLAQVFGEFRLANVAKVQESHLKVLGAFRDKRGAL